MKIKAMLTVGLMLIFAMLAAYHPVHASGLPATQEEVAPDTVEAEEQVAEEAEVEEVEGHALIAGVNFGGMLPFGQNVKDKFGLGVPFSVVVKVPGLFAFGNFSIGAGIEAGFYTASGKNGGDGLTGIPFMLTGTLDLSSFVPEGMTLAAEVNLGMHMQKVGDDSYTNIALLPGVCFGYEVMEGLNVIAKLRGVEILSGGDSVFGGTQEWIDFRIGVEYALPVELPF